MDHVTAAIGPETFYSVEEFSAAAQRLDVPWKIGSHTDDFTASIRRRDFDGCLFGEMRYDPCFGERGSEEIDRSNDRYLCLTLYVDGRLRFMQHGKVIDANRHELMLWDGSAPSRFDCSVTTECEMIWFPRELVERRVGNVDAFLNQKTSSFDAETRILAPYVRNLHRCIESLTGERRRQVIDASIELIFSCLRSGDTPSTPSSRQRQLFDRAKTEIAERICDPLTPILVADALDISVRYLHQIFAAAGTTFSAYVVAQRLERARQALIGRRFGRLSITDLAQEYGFYDSSHFNRTFKRHYGITPSEYRKRQAN